jgi:hypothetical protein
MESMDCVEKNVVQMVLMDVDEDVVVDAVMDADDELDVVLDELNHSPSFLHKSLVHQTNSHNHTD